MNMRRIYLSHSYQAAHRPINEFFWELLRKRFFTWIDTGLDAGKTGTQLAMDVAFNEWMLSQCDGFVAIVPKRRPVSAYQHLEYRLAIRLGLPRLLIIDEDIDLKHPSSDPDIKYTSDWKRFFFDGTTQALIGARIQSFHEQVESFAQALESHSPSMRWIRRSQKRLKVGLLPPQEGAWLGLAKELRKRLNDEADIETLQPEELRAEFYVVDKLRGYDVLLIDVGTAGTPLELVGYLHGIGVPQIRVCRVDSEPQKEQLERTLEGGTLARSLAEAGDPLEPTLPRFFDGYRLDQGMSPIGFWQTREELLNYAERTVRRILQFTGARRRLETRSDARDYFGLRQPETAPVNVFISFAGSSSARPATEKIVEALRFSGFQCFHYQDPGLTGQGRLNTGEALKDGLRMRVEESDIVVVFADDAYRASDHCMNELSTALELRARGELELLTYALDNAQLPQVLNNADIVPKIFGPRGQWEDLETLEEIITAVNETAKKAHRTIDAHVLAQWFEQDGRATGSDLLRPLIQSGADAKAAMDWLNSLTKTTPLAQAVLGDSEYPAARGLLTVLLLSLCEERPTRTALVQTWLRQSRLLNWSGIAQLQEEEAHSVRAPALGVTVPKDERQLGELLGRAFPELFPADERRCAPLCLIADALALTTPLEFAHRGPGTDYLALLRAMRWTLKNASARSSLHAMRTEREMPPSVLLLELASDLAGPPREIAELSTCIRDEFVRLGWPVSRVRSKRIESPLALLRTLENTRHGIVHLAGHMGPGGVEVAGERVDGEALGRALNDSQVRLLVLNGCGTAEAEAGAESTSLTLAELLVRRGRVPEVVAHRGSILENDAVNFALRFYVEFLLDLDLGRAVFEARCTGRTSKMRLMPVAISQRPPEHR